ncbi:MAG TPA: VOC family protein [Vicinamibacterales bacterium]|jgi:catechol 2,3-dioxygenase-like lactoylglutathione lyase family enzyme
MPRIRRILETALDCDHLPATAAFYKALLDVAPMLDTERLVVLDAGEGTLLLLFQRGNAEALETPGGLIPGHTAGGPGHLAFAIDADELAAWETKLTALGVAVESRVTWERGGTSIYFRDPDNRSVELATPGLWPTY